MLKTVLQASELNIPTITQTVLSLVTPYTYNNSCKTLVGIVFKIMEVKPKKIKF